jgi:acyl-CoA thioester hydrolase
VEADYLKPAHFEDELIVETRASGLKGASFDMPQRVIRGEEVLLEALVKVVVLNPAGPRHPPSGGYSRKTGGDHGR